MLTQLYERNRFYTDKMKAASITPDDIRTLDDLTRLPLTTKTELIQAQAGFSLFNTNATYPQSAYTRFHQISGT